MHWRGGSSRLRFNRKGLYLAQRKRMILRRLSGSNSKSRGCIRLLERDGAVVVVDKVFSFMFEGASRLLFFSFIDNKERIAKILERGCKEIAKIPLCKSGVAKFQ